MLEGSHMTDILLWIVIILLFIASYIGLIYPIIPSSLFIWIGFLMYHFLIDATSLGWLFWIAMVGFTAILLFADVIANSFFVKRYGGSKWGERGAAIAVIVGSFIIPPFGIIIFPFITVLVIEIVQRSTFKQAFKTALGSLLGFLGGSIVKIIIQTIMIIWFVITILF